MMTKEDFKNLLSDKILDLMYYDRRECEEYSVEDIEQCLRCIPTSVLINMFMIEMERYL